MHVLTFTVALLFYSTTCSGADINVSVAAGEDWSFPQQPQKSPLSGFFQIGGDTPQRDIPQELDELINCYAVTLTWAQLNPAENSYDFSSFTDNLQMAEADGKCLVVRLKNHIVNRHTPWGNEGIPFIPQWVLDKHSPAQFYTYGPDSSGYFLKVAAPWNTGLTGEYTKFIAKLGEQDLISDTHLKGIYATGISTSAGEEMWLDETGTNNAVAAGMTPDSFTSAYATRFEAWAAAAGEHVGKIVWVGAGHITAPDEDNYITARVSLNNNAADLGLGIRSGGMEAYSAAFSWEWGLLYDSDSQKIYRNSDWGFRDYTRYIGGEDESFSDLEAYDPWFQSSIWIEALVGAGFIWLPPQENNALILRNKDVLEWFALRAGKSSATVPDAAIWLREGYFQLGYGCNTVKNFEIDLYQVDEEGASPAFALLEDRSGLDLGIFPYDCTGKHYDYLARITDVANGNTTISFAIDDTFQESAGRFQIKVLYLDNSSASWRLVTQSNNSPVIQNVDDDAMKTATFTLVPEDLQRANPGAIDFKIEVLGSENLTVKFVRVIKNDPPGDINHSGRVDLQDAVMVLRIVAGLESYPESTVADTIDLEAAINALQIITGSQ